MNGLALPNHRAASSAAASRSARKLRLVFGPADSTPGRASSDLPRVLVVEDDYLMGTDLVAGLTEAGFNVVGLAGTAAEALDIARKERPLLAVTDIRLAGRRDGVDVALELYRDMGIRCIFATAHHEPDMRKRAEPAVPFGWLPKPYALSSLVRALKAALVELKKS